MPGEFDLIAQIRRLAAQSPIVSTGIGDDCASLKLTPGRELLVTTDMLMDGRHFHLDEAGPRAVGEKAMGVNLSDIAAMAGTPLAAVVAVALPSHRADELYIPLFEGLQSVAARFKTVLVGGDTNAWDGPLVICVTVLGEAPETGPALRSSAKPGDIIFVTGPLGGSLLGRHLRPEPRIENAKTLHSLVDRLTLIDLSDGLASDLNHILEESGGLGAILDAAAIPIHPDAVELSRRDGRSPLDHALGDGEDFELCLTVSLADAERLTRGQVPLFRVGEITSEPGLRLRLADGSIDSCVVRGFDHLTMPN